LKAGAGFWQASVRVSFLDEQDSAAGDVMGGRRGEGRRLAVISTGGGDEAIGR